MLKKGFFSVITGIVSVLVVVSLSFTQTRRNYYNYSTSNDADGKIEKVFSACIDGKVAPLDEKIDADERRLAAWEDLHKRFMELRTVLNDLYRNPFNSAFGSMKTNSSNPDAFEVTAQSNAEVGEHKIEIHQIAKGDTLASDLWEGNSTIPAANFTIQVGKDSFDVNFSGGTILDLKRAIQKAGEGIVRVTVINTDGKNYQMRLEGIKTGASNHLIFKGDLKALEAIGLLNPANNSSKEGDRIKVDLNTLKIIGKTDTFGYTQSSIAIKPQSDVFIELSKNIILTEKSKIIVKIKRVGPDDAEVLSDKPLSPLKIGPIDVNEIEDIKFYGTYQIFDIIDEYSKDATASSGKASKVSLAFDAKTLHKTFEVDQIHNQINDYTFDFQTDVQDYKDANGFLFGNRWEEDQLHIVGIEIVDPEAQILQGAHYITTAQDAKGTIDGIPFTRESNDICDLIEGVCLKLKRPTQGEESFSVDHDYDKIAEEMTGWVYYYNALMNYIYNAAYRYMSPEDLKKFENQIQEDRNRDPHDINFGEYAKGRLQKDRMDIEPMRSAVRRFVTNPYVVNKEGDIMLLLMSSLQIREIDQYKEDKSGIGFYNFDVFSEEGKALLIDYDPEIFKMALQQDFDRIRNLFYYDTDGDLIKDDGIFVKMDNFIKDLAVGRSSLIAGKKDRLKADIKNQITKRDKELEKCEKDRDKFAQDLMKIEQTQKQGQATINSLNSRLGNND